MFELIFITKRKLTEDELKAYAHIAPYPFTYEVYVEVVDNPNYDTRLVYKTEDATTEIEVRRCV